MTLPTLAYAYPNPRPLRVLVADDSADTTDSFAEVLRLCGAEVAVAYEGFAVVPVAEQFEPDVCVLDVRMPGIDGWEIARRLRTRFADRSLLLVALTGLQGKQSEDNSADAGFDYHILKPADLEVLFEDFMAFIRREVLVEKVFA